MDERAVSATGPPARAGRREAFHPAVGRVVAGEFTEGPDYDTWREHGTQDWLLIYTVGGTGRVRSATTQHRLSEGDAALLRPGTLHDYGTLDRTWSLAFAHFVPRAEWAPLLAWPGDPEGPCLLHVDAGARPRVLTALRACARASFGQSELFAVNALETALLWLDTQNPTTGLMDDRLLRVVEHIAQHLQDDLSTAELAAVAHLSPSRLSGLFRSLLQVSPRAYVERERLTRAARMLTSTSRAIADIARDVGMNDPLYFSRRFRLMYGRSPRDFRDTSP